MLHDYLYGLSAICVKNTLHNFTLNGDDETQLRSNLCDNFRLSSFCHEFDSLGQLSHCVVIESPTPLKTFILNSTFSWIVNVSARLAYAYDLNLTGDDTRTVKRNEDGLVNAWYWFNTKDRKEYIRRSRTSSRHDGKWAYQCM